MIEIRMATLNPSVHIPLRDEDFTKEEKEVLKTNGFIDGIFEEEKFGEVSSILFNAKLRTLLMASSKKKSLGR